MKTLNFLLSIIAVGLCKAEPTSMEPLMVQPGGVVLRADFTKELPLDKVEWASRQGTRWQRGVPRGWGGSGESQTVPYSAIML